MTLAPQVTIWPPHLTSPSQHLAFVCLTFMSLQTSQFGDLLTAPSATPGRTRGSRGRKKDTRGEGGEQKGGGLREEVTRELTPSPRVIPKTLHSL
ncbi:hypothetical protein E2C01_000588 [Portunus trituberculatus]|uniref:Uncharacterized protein n=1 Tax=Portunus trituberculatus TaxID=210409 RepID=A0A5B7CER2_PORTR|nr:hypothetical protein [Portunus trituberculatus]